MKKYVSFTFDDALPVHLDVAVPALDERKLHGTFYVPLNSNCFTERMDEWKRVALQGHELGNHTIFHPAVKTKPYISPGNALENYTLDRMRVELKTANALLTGLDGQSCRTFAYPCCNPMLGRPGWATRLLEGLGLDRTRFMGFVHRHPWVDMFSSQGSYESVVAESFVAARAGGECFVADSKFPPPRWTVPCVTVDGKSTEELQVTLDAFCEVTTGWLVFMLHGIGGGHRLSCSEKVFMQLLDNVCERDLQVSTVRDVSQEIWGTP